MAETNGASAPDVASPQASNPAAPRPANNPSTPPPQQPSQSQQSQPQIRPSQAVTSTTENPASSTDTGNAVRPHDARTIHMVLASLGVTAYQERVPLQLLDFAYRYTGSVLSDAQHLAVEGYVSGGGPGGKNAPVAGDQITLAALRLATSSRLGYQFTSGLPKQTLLDLARERNAIQLPDPGGKVVFGLHLPHERFVQTGTNWSMLEEWESEEVEEEEEQQTQEPGKDDDAARTNGLGGDEEEDDADKDEDMEDGFEAVFGEDKDGGDEDNEMEA